MSTFRLVGVIHLPPLPGAVNYRGDSVRAMAEAAAEDARILAEAGFTDVMIQDASDEPQPVTVDSPAVAALSAIGAVVRAATDVSLGVVIGHNDGAASVAVAHAIEAQFVRVKVLTGVSAGPTGWIEGCSMQVGMMKRLLGSSVEVWADAHEATSRALTGDVRWAAAEASSFGGADKLIVTRDSGVADAIDDIAAVKLALGREIDVLIGGRVSTLTLEAAIRGADGAILGSALKDGDGYDARIDPIAARRFGDDFRRFAQVGDVRRPHIELA
jgi:membrane complex biogenesis BtpA family protein